MTLVLAHYRYLQSILTGPIAKRLWYRPSRARWAFRILEVPERAEHVVAVFQMTVPASLDTTTDLRRSAAVRVTLHGHDINIINWTMLLAISSHLRHLDIFMHPLSIIIHYLVVREFLRIHLLSHSHPGSLWQLCSHRPTKQGQCAWNAALEMRKIGQSWGISQGVIVQGASLRPLLIKTIVCKFIPQPLSLLGAYPVCTLLYRPHNLVISWNLPGNGRNQVLLFSAVHSTKMQPAAPLHLFSAERLIDETSTFKDFEFNLIGSPWMKSTTFELTTSVCDIPMYPSRRWRIHHFQFSIMRISENLCFSMSFHGNVWPPKGIWWYLMVFG